MILNLQWMVKCYIHYHKQIQHAYKYHVCVVDTDIKIHASLNTSPSTNKKKCHDLWTLPGLNKDLEACRTTAGLKEESQIILVCAAPAVMNVLRSFSMSLHGLHHEEHQIIEPFIQENKLPKHANSLAIQH